MTARHRPSVRASMHRLREAFDDGPFHASQAEQVAVSRQQLEHAARAELVTRLGKGWYALAGETQPPFGFPVAQAQRLMALAHGNAAAVACGVSAAHIWQLPIPPAHQGRRDRLEIAYRDGHGGKRGERFGAIARRWVLPDDHVTTGPRGEPVTTPLRTAIDLARGQPLPFALISLDAALRMTVMGGESPEDARARLKVIWEALRRGHGIRAVGLALPFVDERAESALESIVRGRILEAGLPRPYVQVPVIGASGKQYRADLGLDLPGDPRGSSRLLIEADGRLKYGAVDDVLSEKDRQTDLERRGYRFARTDYREMLQRPEVFTGYLRSLLGA
ncbi:MAG: hypothetical protein ACKOT0_13690 [bacterium]